MKFQSKFAVQKISNGDWAVVNLLSGNRVFLNKILKNKKEALDFKESLDCNNKTLEKKMLSWNMLRPNMLNRSFDMAILKLHLNALYGTAANLACPTENSKEENTMNANDISKIEELEKTIKEAQRQIEEIKNPKPEIWKPKKGEEAYYIDLLTAICEKNDIRIGTVKTFLGKGCLDINEIRDKDDAERLKESLIFQFKLMKAKSSLCPGYDGEGWCVGIAVNGALCTIWCNKNRYLTGDVIFDTEEHAKQAIKWIEDGTLDIAEEDL